MAGISYEPINPLIKLWMISASYIRGEAKQYYRSSGTEITKSTMSQVQNKFNIGPYLLFADTQGKTSIDVFDQALQEALAYDFEGTLNLAGYLRTQLLMRKNPQCIMMEAARHPNRAVFNMENPTIFKKWLLTCLLYTSDAADE